MKTRWFFKFQKYECVASVCKGEQKYPRCGCSHEYGMCKHGMKPNLCSWIVLDMEKKNTTGGSTGEKKLVFVKCGEKIKIQI